MATKKVTANHDEIRAWAEKHRGRPEAIDDRRAGADRVGIRLDFPGSYGDAAISPRVRRRISWEEFFKRFDELGYAFSYHEPLRQMHPTDAYHFIRRERMEQELYD